MTTPISGSPIFRFADELVGHLARRDPIFATQAGITGYDHLLPDFSSEQLAREESEIADELGKLDAIAVSGDVERVAREVIRERLGVRHDLLASGDVRRTFSVLSSPLTSVRQVFELMRMQTREDAEVIRRRLLMVRPALATWRSALADVAAAGQLPAARQILGIAEQASTNADGSWTLLARRVAESSSVDLATSGLLEAADDVQEACAELAEWLRSVLAPQSSASEGSGAERYQRWTRYYTGATLDLHETYEWGYQDLRRINDRMWHLAEVLLPGASSLVAVADHLDNDPVRTIVGADVLLEQLRSFTAATVTELNGVHFDIDERIAFCDARLAPEGSAAAPFYIKPSEDLSRPGTTWYPTLGRTSFSWWREATVWYHESVPGHHLQNGIALLAADRQTRFHRLAGWTSGYGEGWALYAERLMDELGYFSDPADELGYLACQAMRAARIVVDIGLHLGLAAPGDLGVLGDLGDCSGVKWTPAMAVALVEEWALQSHAMSVSEVDRYLGNPAQAISYKVGERVWLEAREEAKGRLGDRFSLKAFHADALALGPMGLDTFASEMAAWDGSTDGH